MTSQPIRLSTNFMTWIPRLTFTYNEWCPWSICNGCRMPAGNAYPSGHLVPSPIVGLACAPIVETRFLELAMSLLDFSPRKPLGTFSIFLKIGMSGVFCFYCFLHFFMPEWLTYYNIFHRKFVRHNYYMQWEINYDHFNKTLYHMIRPFKQPFHNFFNKTHVT